MAPDEQDIAEAEARAQQLRQARERRARLRDARRTILGEWIAAGWQFALRDMAGLAGVGLVSYGAWLAYHPAGFIAGGGLLLAGAWIAGSKSG
jgi:hypothetical protein